VANPPIDVLKTKVEDLTGAQSEASQQQKDGAVSRIFDVPSHGASSALARSSSERTDGNVGCFHCHMRGMAYSKLAGSNPSPVL
jgi:hypothetical protein